jgi:hypothetical protein
MRASLSAIPLAALALGGYAIASVTGISSYAVPDDRLTPGAVATSDPDEICNRGYSERQRVYEREGPDAYYRMAAAVFARYGIAWTDRHAYELDDRIPLCLGGQQTLANLWPEKLDQARVKDDIEVRACRAACNQHTEAAVRQWQDAFRSDWRRTNP